MSNVDVTIKYAQLPGGRVHFYQHWMPKDARALVVLVHDLGDHIGRYSAFTNALVNERFAVALFDQRGHGRSAGRRGHVNRFSDWVEDVAGFVHFSQTALNRDVPLFLVGVGLGALIGINFLLTHEKTVGGFVGLNMLVESGIRLPAWRRRFGTKLASLLPKLSVDTRVRPTDMTADLDEQRALESDAFAHRRVSLGTWNEIERMLELVMGMPHRLHLPTLMLAGGRDSICAPQGTRQFVTRLSTIDGHERIYPNMRHDLLHESGRQEVIAEILHWVVEHADAPLERRQLDLERRNPLWENVSPSCS